MNGTMLQGFSWCLPPDGDHWNRLAASAQRFSAEGITSVWLPPAYKGQAGANDVGYGVYDLYDLGEFDQKGTVATKYGTKDEYVRAVRALRDAGVQALGDIVLNHRMGADGSESVLATECDPANRSELVSEPHLITAWTHFTFPGRRGRYSHFRWDWRRFHGTDWDEGERRSSVFLFDGKHWDEDVDHSDNGNYDYLMGADVDLTDPEVYEELLRWGRWYLAQTGVNGFRLDAIKHMSRSFYLRWLSDLRESAEGELFCVGEYWSPRVDDLVAYLGDEECMSLFDVPLHYNLFAASCSDGGVDLSKIFDDTFVSVDPVHAVTFVENHDTQPGQALQSFVEPWFKPSAYALILLREAGYPCVFYGDLYGLPNDGIPAVRELPLLMELRRRFAFGRQRDYLDDRDVIGWTREGDEHILSGIAVLLTDKDGGEKTMCVGKSHFGEVWDCVLGDDGKVTIDEDGCATFGCGSGRLSVYLSDAAALVLDHDWIHLVRTEDASPYEGPDPIAAIEQTIDDANQAGGSWLPKDQG